MKTIDIYKTRVMELLDEAKLDGIEIVPYEIRIEGYDEIMETGICVSDGKDRIQIPTYKHVEE